MTKLLCLLFVALARACFAQLAPFPAERFKSWEETSISLDRRQAIGYTASTWHRPNTLPLEAEAWKYIERDISADLAKAITRIMSEEQWDCWMNHYEDYWWIDLPQAARDAYMGLGYNETMWDQDAQIPGPLLLFWVDLAPEYREHAVTLCYTPELWDNLDSRVWVNTLGRADLQYPSVRFTMWNELSDENKRLSAQAGYAVNTWNQLDTNAYETLGMRFIARDYPSVADAIFGMGIKAPEWNCYVNHYEGFWWRDMPEYARNAYAILGYNEALFDSGVNPPNTVKLFWKDLTSAQQEAAKAVCYSEETWNKIDLRGWVENLPFSEMNYPTIRYTPWNQLSAETKTLAFRAGYTNLTWDQLDSNDHERRSMRLLLEEHPLAADAILAMGITAPEWNVYVTHYNAFFWDELEEFGKTQYLLQFNWTKETWNNETMPTAWHLYWWWQLPNELKAAATQLGYEDITWDVRDLNQWVNYGLPSAQPTYSVMPSALPSASPSATPSRAPSASPSMSPSLSMQPSLAPSASPSAEPSTSPSVAPSSNPTVSSAPTGSFSPSETPTVSMAPSVVPSVEPSQVPSVVPTAPKRSDGLRSGAAGLSTIFTVVSIYASIFYYL